MVDGSETRDFDSVRDRIRGLIENRDLRVARDVLVEYLPADLAELIGAMSGSDQAIIFRVLPRDLATDTFEYLDFESQKSLLNALSDERVAVILNEMSADDRTQLLEEFPTPAARQLLNLLTKEERAIALKLLGYPENSVGRLMTPDYLAIKPEWSVSEVLEYVRENGRDSDTINILYVLDAHGKLIDQVRIRDVLLAPLVSQVVDLMSHRVVALYPTDDQEQAVQLFRKYDRTVLPVIDSAEVMIGIITIDDVLEVAEEEATEDIQKIGGMEALHDPYMRTPVGELIKKRATWLVVLFIGEMLTASAMSYFQSEIERAVVLTLFIPLIISSGGNSGSQAATLIIRALALGEVALKDWAEVLRRELLSGIALGSALGLIGFLRVAAWSILLGYYGPHWLLIGVTVGFSLVAVVLWGTLSGAMLPFLLKRIGLDPATSSAPFVATLVDVTGLVIYFSIAAVVLRGILL